MREAAAGSGSSNIQDFRDMMEYQEKKIKDLSNFDDKLMQEKEKNIKKDVQMEEKAKRENKRTPHLTNLSEDPNLSQLVYYGMTSFPVTVGRKSQEPLPNIVLGGLNVQRNHAQFILLPKGLIKFEVNVNDAKVPSRTLVNGLPLKDGSSQILHHLDTIYFGPG